MFPVELFSRVNSIFEKGFVCLLFLMVSVDREIERSFSLGQRGRRSFARKMYTNMCWV